MSAPKLEVHGRLLARNTILNALGFGLPLLIAVIAIPRITDGLGPEGFGLLGIVWLFLGYFSELGLGRATTKFVAEALGQGDGDRVIELAWTTIIVQALAGLLLAALLAALAPTLAGQVLRVPPELVPEARTALLLVAGVVPAVLVSSSVRGILEAAQRFDLINAVRIPATLSNYLLPLLALALGQGLIGILVWLLASRVVMAVAYYLLAVRALPVLRARPRLARDEFGRLFAFGGWVTLSSVVSPVLVYLDRFLLGSLVAMSAVAYYTAPYELLARLWILPASLVTTLFPAFSTLSEQGEWRRLVEIFTRSVGLILLVLVPIVVGAIILAGPVLGWWLGPDYAMAGTVALRILAPGMLINSLATIPQALLQGLGRADLPAKFHLLELPVQLLLGWYLITSWGIAGAALAWTARVTIDAALLFWAAHRVVRSQTTRAWALAGSEG